METPNDGSFQTRALQVRHEVDTDAAGGGKLFLPPPLSALLARGDDDVAAVSDVESAL